MINRIITFSVKHNFPRLTAFVFFLFTQRKTKRIGKKKILYLSKPIFNQDVEALIEFGKNLDYISFPRLLLSYICNYYIPHFCELNDGNYHPITHGKDEIIKLRQFLHTFIIAYRKLQPFDLVLSGNFVYTQLQELFFVFNELNIPVVVIYKEGMFPISRYEEMIEIFYKTKRFRGTKILFYNEEIQKTLLKAEVPGITKENSVVVGVPRFDFYYKKSTVVENEKKIVLFSFEPGVKAKYLLNNMALVNKFEKKVAMFHDMFGAFCIKHSDYQLIVKTKSTPTAIEYAHTLFNKYKNSLSSRLELTSSIDANDLIHEAKYIAAYSSTTLIESLIMGKTILSPDFSDIIEGPQDIIYPYVKLVNYITVIHDLEKIIIDEEKSIYEEKYKNEYINKMIYKPDGNASVRSEKAIIDTISF